MKTTACPCAVEFETNLACAVDLYEKVAQLPFKSTSIMLKARIAQMAAMGRKGDLSARNVRFQRKHHL